MRLIEKRGINKICDQNGIAVQEKLEVVSDLIKPEGGKGKNAAANKKGEVVPFADNPPGWGCNGLIHDVPHHERQSQSDDEMVINICKTLRQLFQDRTIRR